MVGCLKGLYRRALVIAGIGAIAIVIPPPIRAQTQASPLRFEVASIRPAKGASGKGSMEILPGGGLKMGGATLKQLIALAYDVRDEQVLGGPKWIGSQGYDLLARPERGDTTDERNATVAPGTTSWDRMRLRTQTLLQERFQLMVHVDAKEQPGYALILAKDGPKVQPSADQGPAGTLRSNGRIDGRRGTIKMLATVLTQLVARPVEDRTGLTGTYDYKVEYTQDAVLVGTEANPPDPSGPSIFTALQEQLGLKLEPSRVSALTIIIDRAEKLSAN
jgi:bla regulator protein BlaR1